MTGGAIALAGAFLAFFLALSAASRSVVYVLAAVGCFQLALGLASVLGDLS